MPNTDFAPWLKNNSAQDDALTELKQFAEAHRAEWPYHSNRMGDYVRVVLNAHDSKEEALLTSLERYFLAWKNTGNGWRFWSAESALLAAGLIVAVVVVFALFYTNLIGQLETPARARGLITFLFSFITIAVIFTKAKDIIAILVGILGTIVGFYFGHNVDTPPNATPMPPVSAGTASAPAGATSTGQPVTTPDIAPATPR
jgi:hypothetical protein